MPFTSSFWDINLLAVLMAGIAHMLTGLVWFLPGLFGNDWMKSEENWKWMEQVLDDCYKVMKG